MVKPILVISASNVLDDYGGYNNGNASPTPGLSRGGGSGRGLPGAPVTGPPVIDAVATGGI